MVEPISLTEVHSPDLNFPSVTEKPNPALNVEGTPSSEAFIFVFLPSLLCLVNAGRQGRRLKDLAKAIN